MCNCRNKEGFNLALSQAVAYEKASGKKAAIFSIGENITFTDLDNISKVEGICCYFTTDSVEHKIEKPTESVSAQPTESASEKQTVKKRKRKTDN